MTVFLSVSWGQIPSGAALLDSMTTIMSPENSKTIISQKVVKADGRSRTFELEMYSTGKSDKVLIRYIRPSSVRGQSFLILNDGDDIWTYSPRTRRVRKIASHAKKQKLQDSDFSFGDFSSEDTWKEDYVTENVGVEEVTGTICWKLRAVAKTDADVDYPTVILYIRKSDYYPVLIEYLDTQRRVEKSLRFRDIKTIDGYPTAIQFDMENHLEGTRTVMKMLEISYDWEPPKGFFSERNLKK